LTENFTYKSKSIAWKFYLSKWKVLGKYT
jgi:hypothetical protein